MSMMQEKVFEFIEIIHENPCGTCNAPCCQNVMIPLKTPTTLMDLDYVRYLLNFPSLAAAVSKTGNWSILLYQTCRHFDKENSKCLVHNTSDQPLTCKYYNPYQCWYRANFPEILNSDIYVLDKETFGVWIELVRFDEQGNVVTAPSFEESLEVLFKIIDG